jgi:hypothetical protein
VGADRRTSGYTTSSAFPKADEDDNMKSPSESLLSFLSSGVVNGGVPFGYTFSEAI